MRPLVSRSVVCCLAATLGLTVDVAAPSAQRPARESVAGQLLVATPEMRDPRFAKAVLYMVRHDTQGAMGLIVNRPTGSIPLARVLEALGMESAGVTGRIRTHYGGPVESARGFVLHSADYVGEETRVVDGAVALTVRGEIFRAIAEGKGPRRSLFALGYAGWAPGQLEAEMQAGHWITVSTDETLVFGGDYPEKWHRAWARRVIHL